MKCQVFIFAQEPFSKIACGHVTHHVKTIYQLKKIKNLNILPENKQALCYFKLKSLWIQGVISFKKGFDVYPSKGLANEMARSTQRLYFRLK